MTTTSVLRRLTATLTVALTLATLGPVARVMAGPSPRSAPACDSTFHLVPGSNPGSAGDIIFNNAMATVSANDIWAVGASANSVSGPEATLAERWDGSSWSAISSPDPGVGGNDFWGVTVIPGASSDATNIWAVGNSTDANGVEHTLAAQYTSTPWNVPSTPNVGTGDNSLRAVVAITSTNIWAVGFSRPDNLTAYNHTPLIEHYDGTSWTASAIPVPPLVDGQLLAVAASASFDVWAVGLMGTTKNTLIYHYNGTSWAIKPSPNQPGGDNVLNGVSALYTTAAYAAGHWVDTNGRSHNLLEKWDGLSWTLVVTVPDVNGGSQDNVLFSVSALATNNIWTAGGVFAPTSYPPPSNTLVEHWDGNQWSVIPSLDGERGSFNEINAILALSATSVWAAGDYINRTSTHDQTLFEHLCIAVPTVTAVAPISGNPGGGTTVAITGTNFAFASGASFGSKPATGFTVDSNTQITATTPGGTVGTVDLTVTNPAGTSSTSPSDTYVYVPPAISWRQYTLNGSDGRTWQPIDATTLTTTFTPTAPSNAVLSANVDLWTSVDGVNQDIGILVTGGSYGTTGQVVGWKESGGFAGTFSPNAAFVQTVIPVAASTAYTATLVWKTNKSTSSVIVAAAGNGPAFSPSRLTAELTPPMDLNLQTVVSTTQYTMTGNDGTSWKDIDATNLAITDFTPAASGAALISANADLWTSRAEINQDLGIFVSGGAFGTGQVVGWKESGGFAGTFSPNAAYAQTVVQLAAGTAYTIKLQWKTNIATTGTIVAGAGNGAPFSPTRLTMHLYPAGAGLNDAASTQQYSRSGSTGSDWMPIDPTNLKTQVTPTANGNYILSGNADLWTATAGVNQDIGIFVSGGAFGSGTLVAWKESGGFAGTFSPNAAFVQTVIPLAMGTTYTITLEWKANTATTGTIFIGAGPWPARTSTYSPTRVTAQLMS